MATGVVAVTVCSVSTSLDHNIVVVFLKQNLISVLLFMAWIPRNYNGTNSFSYNVTNIKKSVVTLYLKVST